jgi:hypothetical protein
MSTYRRVESFSASPHDQVASFIDSRPYSCVRVIDARSSLNPCTALPHRQRRALTGHIQSAFPGAAAFLVDNDGNFASAIPVTPRIPAVSTRQSLSGGMRNAFVTIIFMEFASLC